jgi:galactokinase
MNHAAELRRAFQARWATTPRIFRAPGRVNLIGEHTDYNDGFVMPAAIEFSTWVAGAGRPDRVLGIYSENFGDLREFPLDDTAPQRLNHWTDYVRGVAITLERAGYRLRGTNLLIRGAVPIGGGLSSSAAVEVASAFALLGVAGRTLDRAQIAKLAQRAENEFVGMWCGIMDQFICCHAMAGHALMLDCRSLEFQMAPLPAGVRMVVGNTMVRHELAGGEYNRRRADCQEGVRHMTRILPQIHALRDVTLAELEHYGRDLPDAVFRRCRHVITENTRVEQAANALKQGNLAAFGRLMAESHASLRDDYEVSCKELDTMVDIAVRQPGVIGSRMTGGGFGGCTINLVREDHVAGFCETVSRAYKEETGKQPVMYVTNAAGGAGEVTPSYRR